jgi:hypothetical protein
MDPIKNGFLISLVAGLGTGHPHITAIGIILGAIFGFVLSGIFDV